MKVIDQFLQEYSVPTVKIGDEVLIGKWKNKTAVIKGIKKDKNNQPVLVTDKGDVNLYHFRIKKLMPGKNVNESLKVYPVLKKQRTRIEEYEVCPHCHKEIGEKEYFAKDEDGDGSWYVYHRPCRDKGPIQHIIPKPIEQLLGA